MIPEFDGENGKNYVERGFKVQNADKLLIHLTKFEIFVNFLKTEVLLYAVAMCEVLVYVR